MVTQNAERGGAGSAPEVAPVSVSQPKQLMHLSGLSDILSDIEKISDTMGEDRSGDWSGTGPGGGKVAGTGAQQGISPRDQAIANLPGTTVMVRQLEAHIWMEVKSLRKDIKRITKLRTPGAAFKLNELYKRLRRLQGLLHDILEASYEVVRRLFIKVFIDKQPIL